MNFNATLIGQSIAFIIFVMFVMKYVWPYLLKQMKDREARIADGLVAADKAQQALSNAKVKADEEIQQGRNAALKIIADANKRGDDIVDEAREHAGHEGERIIESARNQIAQEKEAARQALREQVATLVVSGAEQILLREINQAAHDEVLKKMSAEL